MKKLLVSGAAIAALGMSALAMPTFAADAPTAVQIADSGLPKQVNTNNDSTTSNTGTSNMGQGETVDATDTPDVSSGNATTGTDTTTTTTGNPVGTQTTESTGTMSGTTGTTGTTGTVGSVQMASTGMSAEDVIGTNITNADGDSIGTISDLMIGGNGEVMGAVVDVGGFLGMGAHTVVVPWESLGLTHADDDLVASSTMTREQLEALPAFDTSAR